MMLESALALAVFGVPFVLSAIALRGETWAASERPISSCNNEN